MSDLLRWEYRGILKRHHAIVQDRDVRAKRQVEDEFFTEMPFYADIQVQELTQALQQKEEERRQKAEAMRNQPSSPGF